MRAPFFIDYDFYSQNLNKVLELKKEIKILTRIKIVENQNFDLYLFLY